MADELEIDYDAEGGGKYEEEMIETLSEHDQLVGEKSEALDSAFDAAFSDGSGPSDFTPVFQNVELVFLTDLKDDEARQSLSEAIVNAVVNLDPEKAAKMSDVGGVSDKMIQTLATLRNRYRRNLIGTANSMQQGPRWWSNIDSSSGIRSGAVSFEHTVTVAFDETFSFNSSMRATLHLAEHFINQLNDVPIMLGEDSLEDLSPEAVANVEDELEELKNAVEDYHELEEPEEEDTSEK